MTSLVLLIDQRAGRLDMDLHLASLNPTPDEQRMLECARLTLQTCLQLAAGHHTAGTFLTHDELSSRAQSVFQYCLELGGWTSSTPESDDE